MDHLLCLFLYERFLPLPLGEVAERSEDGEGTLSVTCGDSSPSGGAKKPLREQLSQRESQGAFFLDYLSEPPVLCVL